METEYFFTPEKKMMYRIISPTEAILLQILGRDLGGPFSHRHERITYPNEERLQSDISSMQPSNESKWEDLMNEYLQVNKVKLELMNVYRDSQYKKGALR
jgi:hypothetical protein